MGWCILGDAVGAQIGEISAGEKVQDSRANRSRASVRLCTSSFAKMRFKWCLTVSGDKPSCLAIALVVLCAESAESTSRYRSDNALQPVRLLGTVVYRSRRICRTCSPIRAGICCARMCSNGTLAFGHKSIYGRTTRMRPVISTAKVSSSRALVASPAASAARADKIRPLASSSCCPQDCARVTSNSASC